MLASPAPASHIVQLYDADEFVVAAVGVFAAEGLKRGEAVILTGTEEHRRALRRSLVGRDVDYDDAVRRGQLLAYDTRDSAAAVLADGAPERGRCAAFFREVLDKARRGGRFARVRWWGETSNVLHHQGYSRAARILEEVGDAAAKEHGIAVFCSFLCDRFAPEGYPELRGVCGLHSHVIPAQDYVAHRLAVNRAIAQTVGEIRGPLLQSLLSWKGPGCDLPSSQALLFWLHEALPEHFDKVLAHMKAYRPDA